MKTDFLANVPFGRKVMVFYNRIAYPFAKHIEYDTVHGVKYPVTAIAFEGRSGSRRFDNYEDIADLKRRVWTQYDQQLIDKFISLGMMTFSHHSGACEVDLIFENLNQHCIICKVSLAHQEENYKALCDFCKIQTDLK